ncbi:MAG: glycosyltransferase [Sphingobacteriaceae bacterium]|nr:glycosyltransferase [Sphingobacteriaceae bacterium]
MPQVLILCALRPKRSPSQRYRFEQYLPFLESQGFNFTWSYLLNEQDDLLFYSAGNSITKSKIIFNSILQRKKDVNNFHRYDIIFIQREANFLGNSKFEKKAFESGAKVIFDFDDSIWLTDTSPGNKKWAWLKKPEKFFDNIKYAHLVIAGNKYLAEKAKSHNPNTRIIPTTVDCHIHKPMPELRYKEKICIGWSGSISTIKHFETLIPILKKLKQEFNDQIYFKIIAQTKYSHPELEIESVIWKEENEVQELNAIDIGLMPLPDNDWAKGKCGLKGLTYMACGVATIMSNVGVNSEIIQNNVNGILIGDEKDWYKQLSALIQNKSLRQKLGEAGRQTVLEKYSVQANQEKYLSAFKSLIHG